MRVLIAGASGFIGRALTARLVAEGHEVVRLVRRRAEADDESSWAPAAGVIDFAVMDRADAVVNLAGASLARIPWTAAVPRELVASRLDATRTLTDAMRKARRAPAVFVNASAVGFYGDRPGERLTEASEKGEGFLADLADRWEATAELAPEETRVVQLRSGVVLGDGGVLGRVRGLTRAGLGTRLGTGGQHWPWISLDDEVDAVMHLLERSAEQGPFNLTGPVPATADRVLGGLAERLHRPYWIAVPDGALDALAGAAGRELLLASQKALPVRLVQDGFRFRHETVEQALDAAVSARASRPVPAR
ncbi:TIGR01777 family oxidoreductase [Agromyces archimandritae]|uniref:TIGR01777 family oxidoreductase n=1 Tax=Agromyces archimandritae TaxID=2781962 RepID=A0A975FNC9_9MICO|nr:TIGR01777 family oxidoreductase [Agromyces archimandritae]QTX05037.1 TIGR01777 family oxidoreductase [Agromyces archimandritae]